MAHNDKYVVFKREDFERLMDEDRPHMYAAALEVEDAVVIRRQDLFAGPALHSYAHSIALAARIVQTGNASRDEEKRLQQIADYFHEQALLADAEGYKLPD